MLDEVGRARLTAIAEEPAAGGPVFDDDALLEEPPDLGRVAGDLHEWAALRVSRPSADRAEFHGVTGPLPSARAWSVSALETYLECPFKFFAQHVLRLEEEPDDEEVMDPRRQGQFVHEVFEAFFTRVAGRAATARSRPAIWTRRARMFDERRRSRARRGCPTAEAGLERTRLLGSPAAAGLGEAVFRMEAERPVAGGRAAARAPLDGEFTIATAAGPRSVALRGKADRIDLLDDGTFRLIDYKLGWPPDRARALQLPIYGVCAEQRLHGHRGRRWTLGEAVYLAFKGPRRVVPLFTSPARSRRTCSRKAQQRLSPIRSTRSGAASFRRRRTTCTGARPAASPSVCRKDYVGDV